MNRAIRNRLADLLLRAFDSATKREAISWLSLYCELRRRLGRVDVPVAELQAEWATRHGDLSEMAQKFGDALRELEGLLQLHGRDEVSPVPDASSGQVEAHSDLQPHLSAMCARVRTYVEVVKEAAEQQGALARMPALQRAVAEAAVCYNLGLFFEAHEHLEHYWVSLPLGPTKRFIQGIIQVSVGFHHAMRGSYQGAVNQLEKGLAKLTEPCAEVLGLDGERFRREVAEARRQILARGRERMRRPRLDELPRMHLAH